MAYVRRQIYLRSLCGLGNVLADAKHSYLDGMTESSAPRDLYMASESLFQDAT